MLSILFLFSEGSHKFILPCFYSLLLDYILIYIFKLICKFLSKSIYFVIFEGVCQFIFEGIFYFVFIQRCWDFLLEFVVFLIGAIILWDRFPQ